MNGRPAEAPTYGDGGGSERRSAGGERWRRPYEPPAITFRETLEVFAAVCVPGKADPINCPEGPISS